MLDLHAFPTDVLELIIEQLVVIIGIQKAVLLRTVNRAFDDAILQAICVTQVVDADDPATPQLLDRMDPAIRGKLLAVKSYFVDEASKCYLRVIAQVNGDLDALIGKTDHESVKRRHEAVAGAVALYWQHPPIDANFRAQNLLCGAAIIGDISVLKSILQTVDSLSTAVDLNNSTPFFQSPLALAAARGHATVVRHLLDCGTRQDAVASYWYDYRKLIKKAHWNRLNRDIRSLILREGHPSALRAAVLGGHESIARMLLRPEHRLPISSLEYLRAIVAGAKVGRFDLIHALTKAIGKGWSDFNGLADHMLWAATRGVQKEAVQVLLDNGVDVNAVPAQSSGEHTALQIAASSGNTGMIRFLIDRGANVHLNWHAGHGDLPIERAAKRGHEEVVELLIELGADPVAAFASGVEGGHSRLMRALLGKFPDLPFRNEGYVGMEAWRNSVSTGNLTAITILVEAGLLVNDYHQYFGDTPINFAKKSFAPWVVNHLNSLGAPASDVEACEDDRNWCARGITVTERTWEWVGKY